MSWRWPSASSGTSADQGDAQQRIEGFELMVQHGLIIGRDETDVGALLADAVEGEVAGVQAHQQRRTAAEPPARALRRGVPVICLRYCQSACHQALAAPALGRPARSVGTSVNVAWSGLREECGCARAQKLARKLKFRRGSCLRVLGPSGRVAPVQRAAQPVQHLHAGAQADAGQRGWRPAPAAFRAGAGWRRRRRRSATR